uniref:Uncharacterized protein n=1 Tax=Opuntia streptacantha TaxID=393608 RepID=A0A7C9CQM5_OPUST
MDLQRRKKPPDLPLQIALFLHQSHHALTLDLLGTPRHLLLVTHDPVVRPRVSLVSSQISFWPSDFGGYCSVAWCLLHDLILRGVGTKGRAWNVVSFRPD